MYHYQKVIQQSVTPDIAKQFLEKNTYIGQRALKQKHVDEIADLINSGKFRIGEISFGVYQNGNEIPNYYLVNGQHTCSALIKTGKTVECTVQIWKLDDNKESLSELYRSFDTIGKRTICDLSKIEGVALGITWNDDVLNFIVASITYREGLDHSNNRNVKVEAIKRYLPQGNFINSIIGSSTGKHGISKRAKFLCKAAVGRVMIESYEKNPEKAIEFWTQVRDGVNLTFTDPQYKLRDFIINIHKKHLSSRNEIVSRCIHAWNAFISSKSTNLKYVKSSKIPKLKS